MNTENTSKEPQGSDANRVLAPVTVGVDNMPEIKLKNLDEIDFDSPELKAEADEIERRNKRLLESTKPDWKEMHRPFDF